jgi:hypothetical protein
MLSLQTSQSDFEEAVMKRILAACLLAALLPAVTVSIPKPQATASIAREYRKSHEAGIIRELSGLLAIPNVASDTVNIRRNAAALIEMMSRRGIEARLLEGSGPPAIFGELKTPGAIRTVGFYAHYDGQPVEPSKWSSDPFKPILRDKPLEAGGRVIPFPGAGEKFRNLWDGIEIFAGLIAMK